MKRLFVDTSAWDAIADKGDKNHAGALQYRDDKQWSFTDCTSHTLMKDAAINDVFAFDHRFEQMGFNRKP